MSAIAGYRNLTIGVLYLATCCYLGFIAGDQLPTMGNTYVSIGIGTVGVVFGRAANKWAEAKNGGVQ